MNKNELLKKYIRNSPIKWKHDGFVMLPHALLFNQNASYASLLVFWVLTAHLFKGKDYCFPSLRVLQDETRLSKNTVLKGIKELKDLGYLEVQGDRKSGKVNKYYLKVKV